MTITKYLTFLSLDEDDGISFGDDGYVDYYALLRAPLYSPITVSDWGGRLSKEEILELEAQAGAIVHTDNEGFHDITYYEDTPGLEEAWSALQRKAERRAWLQDIDEQVRIARYALNEILETIETKMEEL